MIRKMNPLELKPHPLNRRIYGHDKPDPDLVRSIQEHGVLEQLVILRDGTIISGHRRWKAALACEPVPKIPCQIVGYASKLDEQEALIEYNRQRRKTFSQLMNEAQELERIYKAQSKTNSLNNLKQYKEEVKAEFGEFGRISKDESKPVSDTVVSKEKEKKETHVKELPKPAAKSKQLPKGKRVRDVVAKKVGMSGRTYANARKVLDAEDSEDPEVQKVALEEVEKLNNDETKVNTAYKHVQAAKKGGRPEGSRVEGLAQGSVKRLVQTKLEFFETNVKQVNDTAANLLKEYLEGETTRVTIKAYKTAEREGRKTIQESDMRNALDWPLM